MEKRVRLSTQKEITDYINKRNGALNKINTLKLQNKWPTESKTGKWPV
jgi:hypothetical protein